MKLKPIVATMMLLGLAAPAFAATSMNANAATQTQLDSMKAQINQMQAAVNQNAAGYFGQPCDWFNRITLSGMMNMDAAYANEAPNFATGPTSNVSNLSVNNANVFVDAQLCNWLSAHMNLVYSANRTTVINPEAFAPNGTFDEGYVTVADFSQTPFYARVGEMYVPFGVYDRYPIVMNPTQMLTETQAAAAQVGFVSPMGLDGSVYVFRGLAKTAGTNPRIQNGGADLGYSMFTNDWGLHADAGWIRNMVDVNYIAAGLGSGVAPFAAAGYTRAVNGLSLTLCGNISQFDGAVNYVTALQRFNVADATKVSGGVATGNGQKPKALGLDVGFSFPMMNYSSRLGAGWQHTSGSASNVGYAVPGIGPVAAGTTFGLPQNRYYVGYDVKTSKWTDVGVEVYRDRDYSVASGGTGNSATTGVVQLGVKFA